MLKNNIKYYYDYLILLSNLSILSEASNVNRFINYFNFFFRVCVLYLDK